MLGYGPNGLSYAKLLDSSKRKTASAQTPPPPQKNLWRPTQRLPYPVVTRLLFGLQLSEEIFGFQARQQLLRLANRSGECKAAGSQRAHSVTRSTPNHGQINQKSQPVYHVCMLVKNDHLLNQLQRSPEAKKMVRKLLDPCFFSVKI